MLNSINDPYRLIIKDENNVKIQNAKSTKRKKTNKYGDIYIYIYIYIHVINNEGNSKVCRFLL